MPLNLTRRIAGVPLNLTGDAAGVPLNLPGSGADVPNLPQDLRQRWVRHRSSQLSSFGSLGLP